MIDMIYVQVDRNNVGVHDHRPPTTGDGKCKKVGLANDDVMMTTTSSIDANMLNVIH